MNLNSKAIYVIAELRMRDSSCQSGDFSDENVYFSVLRVKLNRDYVRVTVKRVTFYYVFIREILSFNPMLDREIKG